MTRNNEGERGELFEALAHSTRRDILRHLRGHDFVRAGDIGRALSIAPSTLSGHLKVLRHAGLVETRQRGTEVQYRLQMSVLDELILMLHGLRGADGRPEEAAEEADPPPTRTDETETR